MTSAITKTQGFTLATLATTDEPDLGPVIEIKKWETYYKTLGAHIVPIRGRITQAPGTDRPVGLHIPELDFFWGPNLDLYRQIFHPQSQNRLDSPTDRAIDLAAEIAPSLASAIDMFNIDAIHVDSILSYPFSLPGALALAHISEANHVPLISRGHDFVWETALRKPYERSGISSIFPPVGDRILHVPLTESASARLKNRIPVAQTRYVPNLFDFDLVHEHPRTSLTRREWSASADTIVILQPTRFVPAKAVHQTVHLAALIQAVTTRPVKVVVTGSATKGGGKRDIARRYQEEVTCLSAAVGVDIVQLNCRMADCNGTACSRPRCITSAYLASDVVSFPGFVEGFGNPVIEAISLKVPVICADHAALRDFDRNGLDILTMGAHEVDEVDDNGWTFDIRDPTLARTSDAFELAESLTRGSRGLIDRSRTRADANYVNARRIYSDEPSNVSRNIEPILSWARQHGG